MKIVITDNFYDDLKEGDVLTVMEYDEEYGYYIAEGKEFTSVVGESHCEVIESDSADEITANYI